ncbi:aconitase/3-isopropylmalate dehydratase large subunit family protein [Herbiconiux sp.]|uniref:3-isopropylmalate dehydratase large subunit n=1 Tax=Herbiconiux sp. TaxID=1871186 RepID=UPI0025B9DFCB|nr:aconitase/3-isopropylmalate dehydratase large subunit family protein [Herbiconiux sp.]
MTEKILSRSSGSTVRPGDIAFCDVDSIIYLDQAFATMTEPLPLRMDHPERVSVILDHAIPAPTVTDANGQRRARDFASQFDLRSFVDVGRDSGIVHQVVLEHALVLPGGIIACSDSHTCAAGALNAAGRGLGRLEMTQVLCTGRTWYEVAPTVRYDLTGALASGVYGKDVFLAFAGRYGDHTNKNVEFGGPGVATLAMDDRATIATMCAEVGAEFALFPFDDVTAAHLDAIGAERGQPADPDPDAEYAAIRELDLGALVPMVALPEYVPGNTGPATDVTRRIDQAFIGSCANGKLSDLRVAAEIVRGRRVAPGVRLVVTPASQHVYREAVREGLVSDLTEAGAIVTNSTCGACWGAHLGVLGDGEVCITSSTRNFKGRMGSAEAQIYLGSSATVAASAVRGFITDPRELLS